MGPPKKSGGWNRAAPLKVHHNSHLIHKHSPSPSSSSSSSSPSSSAGDQQQQPVIIYTSAPRIIHTPAKDFMRLVQKLTGLCPSDNGDGDDGGDEGQPPRGPPARHRLPNGGGSGGGGGQFPLLPLAPFSPEIPVFRPASGSGDVFYNIAATVFARAPPLPPPALGGAIPPAVLELMRGLPDYHLPL
ncbi:unnamed protein product [Spirodela intermedia]|uniref:VQ domain-containing protein n=1 Tax=Spirodela intermedia TaxID=51605 RepID=A0A7I8LLC9_SPIIN|nr:unnamed protein product [Spirodela intermedia]